MPQLISAVVSFVWDHPLTIIGILLCAILYVRVMTAGPRES